MAVKINTEYTAGFFEMTCDSCKGNLQDVEGDELFPSLDVLIRIAAEEKWMILKTEQFCKECTAKK